MLQNAYFLAKIDADTAENEQHFAKNLRKTDNYPTGPEPMVARRRGPSVREHRASRPQRHRQREEEDLWLRSEVNNSQ